MDTIFRVILVSGLAAAFWVSGLLFMYAVEITLQGQRTGSGGVLYGWRNVVWRVLPYWNVIWTVTVATGWWLLV